MNALWFAPGVGGGVRKNFQHPELLALGSGLCAKGARVGGFSVVGWEMDEAWVGGTKAPSGKACGALNLALKCRSPARWSPALC